MPLGCVTGVDTTIDSNISRFALRDIFCTKGHSVPYSWTPATCPCRSGRSLMECHGPEAEPNFAKRAQMLLDLVYLRQDETFISGYFRSDAYALQKASYEQWKNSIRQLTMLSGSSPSAWMPTTFGTGAVLHTFPQTMNFFVVEDVVIGSGKLAAGYLDVTVNRSGLVDGEPWVELRLRSFKKDGIVVDGQSCGAEGIYLAHSEFAPFIGQRIVVLHSIEVCGFEVIRHTDV